MDSLAPIILFTYNRPAHTRMTLESLMANELADQSQLYIYCDGPKAGASDEVKQRIAEVKQLIREKQWTREVVIKESAVNKGLARNVIDGVTETVNKHGKAIVLEDDLLLSTGFLSYMNTALDRYEHDAVVKQVSGFLFPIGIPREHKAFFMPLTNTIGWGTWKKEWSEIDLTAKGYEKLKTDKKLRHKFNLDGSYDYSRMLLKQMQDENFGSWAILYWWHVFNTQGLVLYPDYPLVQHNDFDHSGTHSGADDHYTMKNWSSDYWIDNYPRDIESDGELYDQLKKYISKYSNYSIANILLHLRKLVRL